MAGLWVIATRWRISGKEKFALIKNNIARDVHTTRIHVKALVTFVAGTVPKKHTPFRSK